MTPNEIRALKPLGANDKYTVENGSGEFVAAVFLREIAAQLAQLNANLCMIHGVNPAEEE